MNFLISTLFVASVCGGVFAASFDSPGTTQGNVTPRNNLPPAASTAQENHLHFVHPDALRELIQAIQRAFLEKDALREKIDMLRQQNLNLLAHLKNYSDIIFPQLLHLEAVELQRLRNISTKIQQLLNFLGKLEARAVSAAAVANGNLEKVNPLWNRIDDSTKNNIVQNGHLAETAKLLHEKEELVASQLKHFSAYSNGNIATINEGISQLSNIINRKKCFVSSAELVLNHSTGIGEAFVAIHPPDLFGGSIPQTFCGLQGKETTVTLQQNQAHDYGSSKRQSTSLQVDCKAFVDKIRIQVFDHSEGEGNHVKKVWVQVKACSLSTVSGTDH